MKVGHDKETSKLLYSTLFCHFKEPLFSFAKILFSKQKDKYFSVFLLVIYERYLSLEPEFGLSNRPFSLDNLEVKLRFLGQEMIGCDGCYKIDAESIEAPMAGVFNLHDIL